MNASPGLIFAVPFPPSGLSPNGRLHWSKRATLAKKHKREAWIVTLEAIGGGGHGLGGGPISVAMTFHPPGGYRYDVDNLQASMKAALDGIAVALGVDDHRFRPTSRIGEKKRGGCVTVEIRGEI